LVLAIPLEETVKGVMRYGWLPALLLFGPVLAGCTPSQAQPGPAQQVPEVQVSLPVAREVRDYEDFPGRTEAVNSIEVRARVTGYLDKVNFREGADIKEGDVLFEIDPRPYQAELNRAEANVVQSQARLERLELDYKRADGLLGRGAIGREEFDKIAGDRAEAGAAVGVAKAGRDLAELNLSFTKVRSSISGRISRRFIDPGNLVKADDTPLTSIVSVDPIYAYFDLDERTTLRLQRLIREGRVQWSQDKGLPVMLGLADEEGFPQQGTVNFADNRVDPDTGTWRLRGLFANAQRILSPGLFVRIRLPVGNAYQATMVSEQALGTDQGQKFVYVVNGGAAEERDVEVRKGDQVERRHTQVFAGAEVEYRRVKVGRLHDGLRVITEGLAPGEKVVVSGLQRVRPGIKVNAEVKEMPVVQSNTPTADSPRLGPQGGQPTPREPKPLRGEK
jgi:RND family efflux transporter MFP subunit